VKGLRQQLLGYVLVLRCTWYCTVALCNLSTRSGWSSNVPLFLALIPETTRYGVMSRYEKQLVTVKQNPGASYSE